jgi:hypothetical protein
VPTAAWSSLWPAMVLGDVVRLFRQEVGAKVREGDGEWWRTGTSLVGAPLTDVEKTMRGQKATLQSILWNYGVVGCVMTAFLGLTFKQARIDAYREGYVESAVDDQGQGYRRVVWPTLELSPGPETWSRIEPPKMDKRNHELMFKAVFSVA